MLQTSVAFNSKGVTLDGVVGTPKGLAGPFPGEVVCHPHPLCGGDMNNSLVLEVCRALVDDGLVTFRFNFRGVGDSGGTFTKGEEEHEDVREALHLLKGWPNVNGGRLGLVGYSFGASMVLTGLGTYRAAKGFVLISPPLNALESRRLARDKRPKLLIAGDKDRLTPYSSLKEMVDSLPNSVGSSMIPGADHSWRGHETEAAQQTTRFLGGTLQK